MGGATYWALDLCFLGAVAVVAIAAAVKTRRRMPWAAILITFAVVALLTAVFDNVLIALGIIAYEPSLISGVLLGLAPLEDFSYALAAAVLLPSLWILLPARPAGPALPADPAGPAFPADRPNGSGGRG